MANKEVPKQSQQLSALLHPPCTAKALDRRPWREAVLKCYLVLGLAGLVCLLASCSPKAELASLRAVLTSDHWMMELGNGTLQERYVYTFETNGAYKACVFSQFGTRPMKGTWKLVEDQQGFHLLLENEEAYYFCLWRDSLIRFKKEADALVVSGPHYGGEKELRRSVNPRGVTNSAPALKPKRSGCSPAQGHVWPRHFHWTHKAGVKLGSH